MTHRYDTANPWTHSNGTAKIGLRRTWLGVGILGAIGLLMLLNLGCGDTAREAAEEATEVAAEAAEATADAIEEGAEAVGEAVEEGAEAVGEAVDEAKDAAEEIVEEAQEAVEKAGDTVKDQ